MNVLIVENKECLGEIWSDQMTRFGAMVSLVHSQADAEQALRRYCYDVLVLSLSLSEGSALAVADYASYRRPTSKAIYVTRGGSFSDGSIFGCMANACAMVPYATPPADLAALVAYHGRNANSAHSAYG